MNVKVLYDPLYGAVPFKLRRFGVDDFFYDISTMTDADIERREGVEDYARRFAAILRTFEFTRLSFLKQAGFSWLIYPSATHTRYAHSLGCWYLAEQALECVKVRDSRATKGREVFLMRWLETRDMVEEFLLSLLLHDIGHFPFSHVLESNPRYWKLSHEEVGCQLIKGRGEFFELFQNSVLRDTDGMRPMPRQVELLSTALSKFEHVDVDVVSALITRDLSHVHEKEAAVKEAVAVMVELVSGLIDLDRIDHYHRDSHFMGLKIATVSPIALLANMVIVPEGAADPPVARIELEEDGIMQVFSLLESRETLRSYVFENEHNVAYGAMLNAALDLFLQEHPEREHEVLLWTDGVLLNRLSDSEDVKVARLARRILSGSPYARVGRYSVMSPRFRTLDWIAEFKKELLAFLQIEHALEVDETDVLISICKGFLSPRRALSDDWFRLDDIYDGRGNLLKEQDKYSRRIRYFKESLDSAREGGTIQVFASSFESKRYLEKEIVLKGYFG